MKMSSRFLIISIQLFCIIFYGIAQEKHTDLSSVDSTKFQIEPASQYLATLKELGFTLRDSTSHDKKPNSLIYKLLERNKVDSSEVLIEQIQRFYFIQNDYKDHSYLGRVSFQILTFKNQSNARKIAEIMRENVLSSAYFDKPPKCFFQIDNYIFFFTTRANVNNDFMRSAQKEILKRHFRRSEIDTMSGLICK